MARKTGLYLSKMEIDGHWIVIISQQIEITRNSIFIDCGSLDNCNAFLSGLYTLIEKYKVKTPGQKKIINDPSLVDQ